MKKILEKDRRTDGDTGGLLMRALWTRLARRTATQGRTDEERDYYALSEGVYANFAGAYEMLVRPMRRPRNPLCSEPRSSWWAREFTDPPHLQPPAPRRTPPGRGVVAT